MFDCIESIGNIPNIPQSFLYFILYISSSAGTNEELFSSLFYPPNYWFRLCYKITTWWFLVKIQQHYLSFACLKMYSIIFVKTRSYTFKMNLPIISHLLCFDKLYSEWTKKTTKKYYLFTVSVEVIKNLYFEIRRQIFQPTSYDIKKWFSQWILSNKKFWKSFKFPSKEIWNHWSYFNGIYVAY